MQEHRQSPKEVLTNFQGGGFAQGTLDSDVCEVGKLIQNSRARRTDVYFFGTYLYTYGGGLRVELRIP